MNDTDEWRAAVRASTEVELDLAERSHRAAIGLVGDREDAHDER